MPKIEPLRLFLDDLREPKDCTSYMASRGVNVDIYRKRWTIVRDYKSFINYIKIHGLPSIISFDHDLGDNPKIRQQYKIDDWFDVKNNREYTGEDCARWLVEYCKEKQLDIPNSIIHSMNPVGTKNIQSVLAP